MCRGCGRQVQGWGEASPVSCFFTTFSLAWWLGFSRSLGQKDTALKKYKICMFQEESILNPYLGTKIEFCNYAKEQSC